MQKNEKKITVSLELTRVELKKSHVKIEINGKSFDRRWITGNKIKVYSNEKANTVIRKPGNIIISLEEDKTIIEIPEIMRNREQEV